MDIKMRIEKFKGWLLRTFVLSISFAPAALHYFITAPSLWAHASSSAFDLWLGLWILTLAVPIVAWTASDTLVRKS